MKACKLLYVLSSESLALKIQVQIKGLYSLPPVYQSPSLFKSNLFSVVGSLLGNHFTFRRAVVEITAVADYRCRVTDW